MSGEPEFVPDIDPTADQPVAVDRSVHSIEPGSEQPASPQIYPENPEPASPEPASHEPSIHEPESFVVVNPTLALFDSEAGFVSGRGTYVPPLLQDPPPPPRTRRIPNIGDAAIFFVAALVLLVVGEGITVGVAHRLHLLGGASMEKLAEDARLSIPSQAVEYLTVFGLSAAFFGLIWHLPFFKGIRWNAHAVSGRIHWLVLLGIIVGFGTGFGGNFLPMPKDAPIVQDMMNTSTGAWLMFLFSFTGAPLMEELAFRGFMLPSLINLFRWMTGRNWLPPGGVAWVGVPFSVLLTSCCFAMLHGPQVSHSWGPVLLIGVVSLVLCIVRLRLDSVLASSIVHGAYNFTLFVGILVNTDGFRHLDKLKG